MIHLLFGDHFLDGKGFADPHSFALEEFPDLRHLGVVQFQIRKGFREFLFGYHIAVLGGFCCRFLQSCQEQHLLFSVIHSRSSPF